MRIAIASDHAGYLLKQELIEHLRHGGHEVADLGTHGTEPVDYPDYAEALAEEILGHRADRGILLCGSGVGASVAANKAPGIRAGLCHDSYSAHQGVEHDNMNILVLGARVLGAALAAELVDTFLRAEFSGAARHLRRLQKIEALESKWRLAPAAYFQEERAMNSLRALENYGQAIWLDYIRRNLITTGKLKRLVEEDGLSGMTSNPTIFDKAIAGSSDYDDALRKLLSSNPHMPAATLFERLEIEDIRMAAEALRPVYDRTSGDDGYVSLELPSQLAHNTAGSVQEAQRLWREVDRPNIMIKVPCTPEGVQAVEELTAAGVNVNITLMFSLAHYEAVAHAYLRGLRRNSNPRQVSSVASFFVSRVDTVVDRELETIRTPEALALRGKIGIANCKQVYARFRELFLTSHFNEFKRRGARVQRVLWASTSTKNPAYSDVMYVEELIGPYTINTLPPATLKAFRDHGKARPSLESGLPEAEQQLAELAATGVDLTAITEKLVEDGIAAFNESTDKLLASLEEKRQAILGTAIDRQQFSPGPLQSAYEARLSRWQKESFAARLSAKDYRLWSPQPEPELTDRMGWLTLPETMYERARNLVAFAEEVRSDGIRHVVLLGMGGSSLAPEVFQRTFGNANGYPALLMLDSTHPDAVRAVESSIDLTRTLFLVSSKSGTTLETLSFFRYFWARLSERANAPGNHFVAITDPGTPLERLAHERGLCRVFQGPPEVGGRYSALSMFGLVPAALIGVDIHRLLDEAWTMKESGECCPAPQQCPALELGATLGEATLAQRDKVTFLTSPSLAAFPAWVEQLIAESTGKQGKGIVPVVDEPVGKPDAYGNDRLFVYLSREGDDRSMETLVAALQSAGHPAVRITLGDLYDLGQEFFRWEIAVAAAGSILGINPFNQPDVELAKQLAREAMQEKPSATLDRSVEPIPADAADRLAVAFQNCWSGSATDYVCMQAYLAPNGEILKSLENIRGAIRDRLRVATTCGYGPRFLHSTGQLHKGGPNTGLYLQLVDEPGADLAVPETTYSFGSIIKAQAVGDFQALKQRGRRVIRINIGRDTQRGLSQLSDVLQDVISRVARLRAA